MSTKISPITEGSLRALNALKANDGVTLAQLNEAGAEVASAHLTSLVRRGLVSTEKIEIPVTRMQEVNVYRLTEAGASFQVPTEE